MNIHHMIQEITILTPPFLLALTLHEVAHGWVADRLGDPTARMLGRLTLNPLKHLDPLGVLCFFIMKIGWAKPVPVNAANLRRPRQDMLWVALAGPLVNLTLAVASSVVLKILLMTIHFIPAFFAQPLIEMVLASVWINILLAVFNILPIPPLDGSKILMGLLPPSLAAAYGRLERYGFLILLLLFYIGLIPRIISPITSFAQRLLLG